MAVSDRYYGPLFDKIADRQFWARGKAERSEQSEDEEHALSMFRAIPLARHTTILLRGGRLSMIPWLHLDSATVPGGGELRLMRRGNEFAIMAGATPLMNSRMSSSETALAELACDRLRDRRNCSVLIGGYGMGFTLRAALAGFGADARILVAELVPAVMEWARGPMAELTAGCLGDPRVSVRETDV